MSRSIVTAIPVFCNQVAFHFAWCSHVLLVETVGDRVLKRQRRSMPHEEPWDMARTLVAMNIDQLVCRFIPLYFRDWFERKQVRVIDYEDGDTQSLPEALMRQLEEAANDGDKIDSAPVPYQPLNTTAR